MKAEERLRHRTLNFHRKTTLGRVNTDAPAHPLANTVK